MPKKIILTEQQFDKLQQFIVETKFDVFIQKNAKVNDIIRIEFKNSVNNYKVISNDNGRIQMDNIDAGSANINYRYFMSFTGLDGNRLSISKVHKTKEADKLDNPKSWKPETLSDVKNIELIRGGKVVDKVDEPKVAGADKEKTIDFSKEAENILSYISSEIKEGKGVLMTMDNKEKLLFCCIGKTNNSITIELTSKTKIMALRNYDSFIIEMGGEDDSEEINIGIIKSENGDSFSLRVKGITGESSKDLWIKGILGISATVSCTDSTEEEPKGEKKVEKPVDKEELKADAKKAMEMILKDDILKKAFYSQPSLWDLFVAELTGKKATGKGIVPVLNILDRYQENKTTKKLGANFKEGKTIVIQFLEDVTISFNHRNKTEKYTFDNQKTYEPKVLEQKLGENQKLGGYLTTYLNYEIELIEKTDKDTYLTKVKLKIGKGTEITDKPFDGYVKIKIIEGDNSPGYKPIKETE